MRRKFSCQIAESLKVSECEKKWKEKDPLFIICETHVRKCGWNCSDFVTTSNVKRQINGRRIAFGIIWYPLSCAAVLTHFSMKALYRIMFITSNPITRFPLWLSPLALHYLINFLTPFVPFFKSQIHNLKSTKCDTFFYRKLVKEKEYKCQGMSIFF